MTSLAGSHLLAAALLLASVATASAECAWVFASIACRIRLTRVFHLLRRHDHPISVLGGCYGVCDPWLTQASTFARWNPTRSLRIRRHAAIHVLRLHAREG